ncbi:putative tubulin polyglutamylase TTLL2 [Polymixia lowei]
MWHAHRREPPPPRPLVFRLHDGTPELVREVLLERGWEEYNEGEHVMGDWNLTWRASAFRNSDYENLLPWQRLNHHPKTVGITRKDCLARNLRRMKGTFGPALYDFSPTAFILPSDYTRFWTEYTKHRQARGGRGGGSSGYWICKPVALSRGRGIFIFEDMRDLVYSSSVIVQRYISNPLLISGYKFDLRIYACVKSFHPLTIYMYQEGLVRFATEKYKLSSLDNVYAHLTNTSINKLGPFYAMNKERVGQGCKWTMSKFRYFLRSQGINELLLWQKINNIVTLTLLTIAPSVPSSPNCVELFGFDILIDCKLKPWLLEVNYSPALTLDCQADVAVKKGLISDLIDLMNYRSIDSLRERAYQRQRIRAVRGSLSNTDSVTVITAHDDRGLNPILSPHIRTTTAVAANRQARPALASCLRDNRALHMSEVTYREETEVETSKDGVFSPTTPELGLRCLRETPTAGTTTSAGSYKIPDIHSPRHRLLKLPWRGTRAQDREKTPPLRVGDFILTFPFNNATLKASQNKLDVKIAIQEVHKLIGQLASGCSQSEKRRFREEGKVKRDEVVRTRMGEEEFETLFWGPKDPPLLSECYLSK